MDTIYRVQECQKLLFILQHAICRCLFEGSLDYISQCILGFNLNPYLLLLPWHHVHCQALCNMTECRESWNRTIIATGFSQRVYWILQQKFNYTLPAKTGNGWNCVSNLAQSNPPFIWTMSISIKSQKLTPIFSQEIYQFEIKERNYMQKVDCSNVYHGSKFESILVPDWGWLIDCLNIYLCVCYVYTHTLASDLW